MTPSPTPPASPHPTLPPPPSPSPLQRGSAHRLSDKLTSKQLKHLLAGGVAGAVSRTCVSPLERMKILFQVYNKVLYRYIIYIPGAPTLSKII